MPSLLNSVRRRAQVGMRDGVRDLAGALLESARDPLRLVPLETPQRILLAATLMLTTPWIFYLAAAARNARFPEVAANWDSLTGRAAVSACSVLIFAAGALRASNPASRLSTLLYCIGLWLAIPVFFSWTVISSGGHPVWVSNITAAIVLYCILTDWRVALPAFAAGWFAAVAIHQALPVAKAAPMTPDSIHLILAGSLFAAAAGICAALLTATIQRVQNARINSAALTAGVVAHELRTPVAAIALLAHSLESGDADPTEAGSKILRLVERVHASINLSVSVSGAVDPLPAATTTLLASEIVREAVDLMPYRSNEERDMVRLREESDFYVEGDRNALRQVVENLLRNALAATMGSESLRNRALKPWITIRILRLGVMGAICVEDAGGGISKANQRKLFKPFYTTNQQTGRGLGLYYSMQVARQHGGTIQLFSVPGQGSTFTVELPTASWPQSTAPTAGAYR